MTTALASRMKVDVSTDNTNWTPLRGITDLNPGNPNPTNQDVTDYDNGGWQDFEKTVHGWSLVAKCRRKTTTGTFDPGQELARLADDQLGDNGKLYVRWYDRNGAPEAYTGLAIITYAQSKTGAVDYDEVTITFTGSGARTAIANPFAPATAPVILKVAAVLTEPAGTGAQIKITGSGFTGTVAGTGVKSAAAACVPFAVVSDSLIIATLPSQSAGATAITVTNATGVSNSVNYTRGA